MFDSLTSLSHSSRRVLTGALLTLALLFLAACAGAETPTPTPTLPPKDEPGTPPAGYTLEWLASLPADTVLFQQDSEGGFTLVELSYSFGRFPPFTLFADGRLIFYEAGRMFGNERVLAAQLSPAETLALFESILALGYTRLESYTSECQQQPNGSQMCIADAGVTILRAQLLDGPSEVKIYADFANDREAFDALFAFTDGYTHSAATPFRPTAAALFISKADLAPDVRQFPWPLSPDLLAFAPSAQELPYAIALAGDDLQAFLNAAPRNSGDMFFFVGEQGYRGFFVPWLPNEDFTAELQKLFPAP